MARNHWRRGLRSAGGFALVVLGMFPIEVPGIPPGLDPIRTAAARYGPPQDPGGADPFPQVPDDSQPPRSRSRSRSARKKTRLAEKKANKKADTRARSKVPARGGTAAGPAPAAGAGSGPLAFSRDIAPILVDNCRGCHTKDGQGRRRGKLDMSSFESLQKGTGKPDHPVLVAGKPEASHLVQRITGDEEPAMPQGNNRALSAEAIATITRWVKEGARLDAGIDPKAPMDSYAASPEQVRKNHLAQTPVKERDQKVIEEGKARWNKTGAKPPEVKTGRSFILFSNLPGDRASHTLKAMELPLNRLKRLLGPQAMDWPEKVSLFVFSGEKEYQLFVSAIEGREVESEEPRFTAKLGVPQPYVAVLDPSGGKADESPRRRAGRKKAEESEGSGSDRTLPGLLAEGVGSGSVAAAGNAPRWLRDGIGLDLAATADPRSRSYYRRLIHTALRNIQQDDWMTKATGALGGQLPAEDQRAVGFALVECMMNSDFATRFPTFLRGMLADGQGALDNMLEKVYGLGRDEFINLAGQWIVVSYGQGQ